MHRLQVLLSGSLIAVCLALSVPAAAASLTHTVQAGDTVSALAARYGVTVTAIVEANQLRDPNLIRVGQRLMIPGAVRTHTVARGETLGDIARRYDVTLEALVAANALPDPDHLVAGQRLVVPAPGNQPAPPPAAGVEITGIGITPSTATAGWQVVAGPASLGVQARGAVRVEFWHVPAGLAQEPVLLGSDTDGEDGWALPWTPPADSAWHVWAAAYSASGAMATSMPLNVYGAP